jgi:hypothetical protein
VFVFGGGSLCPRIFRGVGLETISWLPGEIRSFSQKNQRQGTVRLGARPCQFLRLKDADRKDVTVAISSQCNEAEDPG